jgi:hypothetical protein
MVVAGALLGGGGAAAAFLLHPGAFATDDLSAELLVRVIAGGVAGWFADRLTARPELARLSDLAPESARLPGAA